MPSDPNPTYPVLPAYEVRDPDGGEPQWVVWCPWCEITHRHGPFAGHRIAHCYEVTSATIAHGYVLEKAGDAAKEAEVEPRRYPRISRMPIARHIDSEARNLRASALRALLPVSKTVARQDCFVQALDSSSRLVVFDADWWIEEAGKDHVKGVGLLQMGAEIRGVSAGVLAVRFLEALQGWCFDDVAARAIAAAVGAWVERGCVSRDGRKAEAGL